MKKQYGTFMVCLILSFFSILQSQAEKIVDKEITSTEISVELLDFKGLQVRSYIELSWKTRSEVDFDKFEVQIKKRQGFKTIGQVEGNGSPQTLTTYSYTDTRAEIGKNVYRLAIIDRDGTVTYFEEIEVELQGSFEFFNISPNPATTNILIEGKVLRSTVTSISIIDINGKIMIAATDCKSDDGELNHDVDISLLASGYYYVKLVQENDEKTLKFLKE